MKRLLLCGLAALVTVLLPACESERQVTTTTTTEETVAHPAAVTQTTRTTAY